MRMFAQNLPQTRADGNPPLLLSLSFPFGSTGTVPTASQETPQLIKRPGIDDLGRRQPAFAGHSGF
jgi:hypothetical protein